MTNFGKDDEKQKGQASEANQARLRGKIGAKSGSLAGQNRQLFGASSGMQKSDEFNNMNRYVIDDDDEEDESAQKSQSHAELTSESKMSEPSQPREIVFQIEDD